MPRTDGEQRDFFISYTSADVAWAEWIASQLEPEWTTVIQAWDFDPGNNFVLEMQRAARMADKTIVVLSQAFLDADFTQPEWAAAFASDPTGVDRKLIPVRVTECEPEGMLKAVVYIDLVGLDAKAAAQKLIGSLQPGRKKPLTPPPFPGSSDRADTVRADAGAIAPPTPRWHAVTSPVPVLWRRDIPSDARSRSTFNTCAEVHLIPLEDQRVEVRRLASLTDELAAAGREAGFFSQSQQLHTAASDQLAATWSDASVTNGPAGFMTTRSGGRGFWIELPRDNLGSVFDPEDLTPRLARGLRMVSQLRLADCERFAVGSALAPVMMLTAGSADIVGRRNSASMLGYGQRDIILPPEDSVASRAISSDPDAVAEEIIARLAARLMPLR
ncbi:MAG: toll/interleukin-1 receptor domain-containing protein [Microbacterium arborescens]